MIILGLNAFHGDSAACLVKDGVLIAAAEEERFRRIKHWAGFPAQAIRYCLDEAGLKLADVDIIAVNQDSRANLARKIAYVATKRPDLGFVLDRLKNRRARRGIAEYLAEAFLGDTFKGLHAPIEHHLAHLSSAFHVSPFRDASIVSVDGFGDFSSAAWARGHDAEIDIEGRVYFPHSLGIFYQALTQYLGFPHYGDEYKVMGLAPYGAPTYLDKMRRIVALEGDGGFKLNLDFFNHHRQGTAYQWTDGIPDIDELFSPALVDLLGPRRHPASELTQEHRDLARSVQAMYEEAFFNLLDTLYARHQLPALTIAGGCGNNSVANGKVRRQTGYQHVYVQSAAGDAGGAIGAAFAYWHQQGSPRGFVMDHAYWGPGASDREIEALMIARDAEIEAAGCSIRHIADEAELTRHTATAISDGKVIGWYQGRMEWGPRALGNRSILGDPRRADMKDILNRKIKRRESFRPFAPSVLDRAVPDWFEEDDAVPFMMQVFQIREEQRVRIPAVAHVDGSGRLQTVSASTNPRYFQLIEAFEAITGVPMLLNTSFNENEPVVCRPGEALDCFLRTKMDLLVLGDVLIERRPV
ncbi:carbamoyltransferase [Sphingomonas qilianensis]|uniref:Carbamoyltransferase C-terminal domain-containing protein n=1 Tax=Sphingomonas qilianensis TaxID=1736690 RepID=A0ABU9XNM5_9SPHN